MDTTTSPARLALIPVQAPRPAQQAVVRRYRFGRVVTDLGPALAGRPAAPSTGERAP